MYIKNYKTKLNSMENLKKLRLYRFYVQTNASTQVFA